MIEFESHFKNTLQEIYENRSSDLKNAVFYSAFAGGKRVRSKLCLLACQSEDHPKENALVPAMAIEMLHTYSLIHDDLPAMDNDDLRRGKPTCHKVFGEALAILAGDALLTDAFFLLSDFDGFKAEISPLQRLKMIKILSRAAGSRGMILGQAQDIQSVQISKPDLGKLQNLHGLKTGQLLGAALAMGGIAAQVLPRREQELFKAGEALGVAFQIKDDLLDLSEHTGKTPGKDKAQGKFTILSLMSPAEAEDLLRTLTADSVALIDAPGSELEKYIFSLLERTY